jgi:hypothetical protein
MDENLRQQVEPARQAALEVLIHNSHGPFDGLPRTAAWGYPEPYTRDLMISAFGILASRDERLVGTLRRVLEVLADNQTARGHIPSLVNDPDDLGASDTTPLFLIATHLFRTATGEEDFLEGAVQKALSWMAYQSPDESGLIAQLPTSDWRDEQWVLGYGLFVNALAMMYCRLYRLKGQASISSAMINSLDWRTNTPVRRIHEGLRVPGKPFYALWSYKHFANERFDLLGNSLAILSGIASQELAHQMIAWVEAECAKMRIEGELSVDLPPCLIPYIYPGDEDWYTRMEVFNQPGHYHNGGIWPFVCGFYIAALVAVGKHELAESKLAALTQGIRTAHRAQVDYGFNEWLRAQDGSPQGQDWQTWSAAMYLYSSACVESKTAIFLEQITLPMDVESDP